MAQTGALLPVRMMHCCADSRGESREQQKHPIREKGPRTALPTGHVVSLNFALTSPLLTA